MIRFVYIGDQILRDLDEEHREFAIYDTVTDSFICLSGSYTFDSYQDLEEYLVADDILSIKWTDKEKKRILDIIPDWYRNGFSGPNVGKEIRS